MGWFGQILTLALTLTLILNLTLSLTISLTLILTLRCHRRGVPCVHASQLYPIGPRAPG